MTHAVQTAPELPVLPRMREELAAAVDDSKDWWLLSSDTFYAACRRDGQVTVNVNSGGFWLVTEGSGGKQFAEQQPSAQAAIEAGEKIAAKVAGVAR